MRSPAIRRVEKDVEHSSAINVLVAYGDLAGEQRAQKLLARMSMALPSEDPNWLCCTTWQFNHHMTPQGIEVAAEQAAVADVIFVATQEREKMPHVLEEWVGLWLPQKVGHHCALVALLGDDGKTSDSPGGIRSYLQEMAQTGNLDFFARNEESSEFLEPNTLFDSVFEQDSSLLSQ
jgi:hypothetical protein